MRDPTAMTEPLTQGQQIVAAYERDTVAEPCELAEMIDVAIAAERKRCAKIVRKLAHADVVYPEGMQMIIEAIETPEALKE